MKVDLCDLKNLLPREKVAVGIAAQALLNKSKASDLKKWITESNVDSSWLDLSKKYLNVVFSNWREQ